MSIHTCRTTVILFNNQHQAPTCSRRLLISSHCESPFRCSIQSKQSKLCANVLLPKTVNIQYVDGVSGHVYRADRLHVSRIIREGGGGFWNQKKIDPNSGFHSTRPSSLPTSQSASYMYPVQAMPAHSHSSNSQEGSHVRVVQSRPKPRCWDHGCNGRQFSTFSNLLRHQREKSGQATKATCPNCGAEFTRTTARNGHLLHDKCKRRGS